MYSKNRGTGALVTAILSTFLVACAQDSDSGDRTALERESLERELELALQPDTTRRVTLTDIPLEVAETPTAPPAAAPTPAPQPTPTPQPTPPRQTTPRPSTPPPAPAPAPAPAPPPTPAPAPVQPRISSYTVPAGTTFGVRFDEQLSTNSHRIGSTFTATLTEPILASDGRVLIPSGATVRGEVIESRESSRSGEEARLAVAFTSINYGGRTYSIAGSAMDTPVRLVTRDSRTEQAAKIGGGAAIGAVIGQVLGGSTRATVAGAAVGAAAGTAVAIGTADVDAVVDAGAQVTIRLDRGVTMEG